MSDALTPTIEPGEEFLSSPLDPLRYERPYEFEPDDIIERLCQLIPVGSRILDVGCGTGAVGHPIQERAKGQYMGIEPNARRAEAARQRGLNVVTGYLTAETFRHVGPFDIILFADVLEHVPEPAALLRIAKCGLAPSGSIVVSVPNVAHWSVRLNLLFGRFNYAPTGIMDSTHLRWFTRKSVEQCFESAGLRCQRVLTTAGLTLPVYTNRIVRKIPRSLRNATVRRLNRWFPNAFGCQFIVSATPHS